MIFQNEMYDKLTPIHNSKLQKLKWNLSPYGFDVCVINPALYRVCQKSHENDTL